MNNEIQYDNAEITNFNSQNQSNILFQCEHATNDLPPNYSWNENDLKNFKNTHWAIDHGALKLAQYLAQKTNSILVNTKYSRLFCDVNRQIQSENLCRTNGDNINIELNQNISHQELIQRIQFHSSYHLALREVIHTHKIKKIYSIHSFTPLYEGQIRNVEVGILTSLFDEFGEKHQQPIIEAGFNCKMNEPYTGKKGLNFSIDCSCLATTPSIVGTLFEVRSDILQNNFQKIADTILNAIVINN